ncbi:MAG: DNA ligase D [Burkholderiales bacterium]|nr:DNA ligase D [Burkholderiales bacterium]
MAKSSRAPSDDPLHAYRGKRDFTATPEPAGEGRARRRETPGLAFVIQKHWARRLHYDLRLEVGGVMKSWAVPKGPSLDPHDKRMAVQVEDHPIDYNQFEGTIPEGHYGAGKVIVWDRGEWLPVGDPVQGLREGKLKFHLRGHKLEGGWTLVRMHGRGKEKQPPWLLIKERDDAARPAADYDITVAEPSSVSARAASASRAASGSVAAAKAAGKGTARVRKGRSVLLPESLSPQLATLVDAPPAAGSDWIYELKFDGYRLLARVERDRARLFTRNGHDWTDKLPDLARAVARLPLKSGWIDGEIIAPGTDGAPDFQALQNAFDLTRTAGLVYYVFDLPFADGEDLRALPVVERRERLRSVVAKAPSQGPVRFSEDFEAPPRDLVTSACGIGFEGVIGKRRDAPYASRRNADWIKLKCSHRQEFVIGGYTDPQGSREGLGSLLLGVHDDKGKLRYAGNVGTGFSTETLAQITQALRALHTDASPFDGPVTATRGRMRSSRGVHWVKPQLLAEVSFAEWTREGRIRHSVFHGLRSDKKPRAIVREEPRHIEAATAATARRTSRGALPEGMHLTHGDRVIDAEAGVTKLDLARHYAAVAPLILEHLRDRPVAMLRAPKGIGGELFFQKHQEKFLMQGIDQLDPSLDPGHGPLMAVAGAEGLLSAAQMNMIELHTWNALKDRIERPDRLTFDLDPGEGVAWPQMQEAAELVRCLLDELGLVPFLKTSGGKGLHVVVPIKRLYGWDEAKGFSQAVVQHLARMLPDRFVAKSGPRNRVGKIFVDYLRNGRGATTVAAWSARARPGMGVSVPVRWDELPDLTSGAHWRVVDVAPRMSIGNTPWKGYARSSRSLGTAMKALGLR